MEVEEASKDQMRAELEAIIEDQDRHIVEHLETIKHMELQMT